MEKMKFIIFAIVLSLVVSCKPEQKEEAEVIEGGEGKIDKGNQR